MPLHTLRLAEETGPKSKEKITGETDKKENIHVCLFA
jgi:hypothetical protein